VVRGVMARMIPQFTYNPEIAAHVSYSFPVAQVDAQRIAEVRDSAANAALNAVRFAPLYNWLKKLEIM
jgi:type II secretory pathway component PulM